jgi:tyrosine 3-monooxygenase
MTGNLEHLETICNDNAFDIFMKFESTQRIFEKFCTELLNTFPQFSISCTKSAAENAKDNNVDNNEIWFPTHVSEMDKCNHLVLKFQPEMTTDHPGFHDKEYRARRMEIADIAFNYRHGIPIPLVEYNLEELDTWKQAYNTLNELYNTSACTEHVKELRKLEEIGLYSPNHIPQLEDVSNHLKKTTGFRLRPVAGLLSARDFLASLAFRMFQCTQFIRHHSKPLHTPEPDCIHELLGHIPMLCNEEFADFSQEIGLSSLGASDDEIEKIATLYWFTVEFGLVKQDNKIVAFGAGLLSAYGELKHAISNVPEQRDFDPKITMLTPYRDEDYQPIYYVAESISDMKIKMNQFTRKMLKNKLHKSYNPYTERIEVTDSETHIKRAVKQMLHELEKVIVS